MSRYAAIDVALRLQLAADGKKCDYTTAMNALTNTAGNAAPYTDTEMKTFLLNVANRLRLDTPEVIFPWVQLDAAQCLPVALPMLISMIECTISTQK